MDPSTLQTIGIFLSPVIIVAVMIQLNNVTNKRIDILTGDLRSMIGGISTRLDRMDDKFSHRFNLMDDKFSHHFDLLEDKFTRHLEQHSATNGGSSSSQKEN